MRVALLCNMSWLDEELSMFQYMVAGLIGEAIGVVQVLPDRFPEEECNGFGVRIVWKDSPWDRVRVFHLSQLVEQLKAQRVDLIHAMEGPLWTSAVMLAKKLGCTAVLGARSAEDVPLAQRLLKRHTGLRLAVAPATEPLAQAMAPWVKGDHLLRIIRPGVYLHEALPSLREMSMEALPAWPTQPAKTRRLRKLERGATLHDHASNDQEEKQVILAKRPLCAVISGSHQMDEAYQSLLAGLAAVVQTYPQSQFFLDAQDAHRSDQRLIWKAARDLGLLGHVSFIPRRLGHTEMLLEADLLIHPQPLGVCRGLTLQAMERGIPILAYHDPWVDYLVQDKTAWLIGRPVASLWTAAIERAIQQPREAKQLGESAREWVSQHHEASACVEQTIQLYREVLGEPYQFPVQQTKINQAN